MKPTEVDVVKGETRAVDIYEVCANAKTTSKEVQEYTLNIMFNLPTIDFLVSLLNLRTTLVHCGISDFSTIVFRDLQEVTSLSEPVPVISVRISTGTAMTSVDVIHTISDKLLADDALPPVSKLILIGVYSDGSYDTLVDYGISSDYWYDADDLDTRRPLEWIRY